jgi:hypothetical protein
MMLMMIYVDYFDDVECRLINDDIVDYMLITLL